MPDHARGELYQTAEGFVARLTLDGRSTPRA